MNARVTIAIIAVASLLTSGCVLVTQRSYEKLSRQERRLPPAPAVPIAVSFSGQADAAEYLAKVYRRVKGEREFLANAEEVEAGPQQAFDSATAAYRLQFAVSETENGWGSPELTGLTFGLVPYYMATKTDYRATLSDHSGAMVSEHTATTRVKAIVQLWLIYASPVSLVALKDIHVERKMVRALLNLVERDIRRDLALRDEPRIGSGDHTEITSPNGTTAWNRISEH